jgi:hypothetical protein
LPDWYRLDPYEALDSALTYLAIVDVLQAIPANVPPEDCVISTKSRVVTFLAHRASQLPPLNAIPDPEFRTRLRATGCRFVFMMAAKDRDYPVLLHPYARIRNEIEVVDWRGVVNSHGGADFLGALLARLKPAG